MAKRSVYIQASGEGLLPQEQMVLDSLKEWRNEKMSRYRLRSRSMDVPVWKAAIGLVLLCLVASPAGTGWATAQNAKPSLDEAMAQLKVPPDWFDEVKVEYDTNLPWKDARLEVRRLLSLNRNREAIKLTVLYLRKGDIGDGHEYPMYLYMGGEYAWAVQEYRKRLASRPTGPTHEYLSLVACYRHFGEYAAALELLDTALQRLPDPPWRIAREADIHDYLGDIHLEMGNVEQAIRHYQRAIALYPTSDQPYGRHLLRRRAAKIQAKLDLLTLKALESSPLRDGAYTGTSLGYVNDVTVTVTIKAGTIADVRVQHEEKIDQNATTIVPQRILAAQSLKVDGVTGATVTYDAIIHGALQALRKAGLQ